MGANSPHLFSQAFKSAKERQYRYNVAEKGSVIAIVYGTQRASVNLIDGFGFSSTGGSGKTGGKGGTGKSSKKSGPKYSVNVCFALCQGPVTYTGAPYGIGDQNRVWANAGTAAANAVSANFYSGSDGQAPDPVFESSSGESPVLGYSGTAIVTATPMQLGTTPALPNVQVEVTGFGANTCGTSFPGDARPDWIVIDALTNDRYGAGFPIADLDCAGGFGLGGSVGDWGNYCQAIGLAMSYKFDRQQPMARWIEEIVEQTNAAIFVSGPLLKIVPYGDYAISNFGASWTPNLTWQYSLTDDDFLDFGGGSDPVIVTRGDPSQVQNWITVEYESAAYEYNSDPIPVFDQAAIDQYGVVPTPSYMAPGFTNPTSATVAALLKLQRGLYVRNTYKFKLGWRYALLEPMDIVLITDPRIGLSGVAVRISEIDEDENGELTITAEEIPGITP